MGLTVSRCDVRVQGARPWDDRDERAWTALVTSLLERVVLPLVEAELVSLRVDAGVAPARVRIRVPATAATESSGTTGSAGGTSAGPVTDAVALRASIRTALQSAAAHGTTMPARHATTGPQPGAGARRWAAQVA